MRGKIVIPLFYKERHRNIRFYKSTRSKILFRGISKKYNLPIEYTNTPKFDNVDFAVIYAVPYHNRPLLPPGLLNLDRRIKLIAICGDLQCWENKLCEENKLKMFERYDVILSGYKLRFQEWYPQFMDKTVFFPSYFAPQKAYTNLETSKHPRIKCLLTGNYRMPRYPFRAYIKRSIPKRMAEFKGNIVEFPKYPKLLNSYFCSIATKSTASCMVAKYFEIPAAGTLLLAEKFEDLEAAGLKPFVHYIPINKENVFATIDQVLSHPKRFIDIRRKGTSFVRKNHGVEARIKEFGEILKKLEGNRYENNSNKGRRFASYN